MTDRDTRREPVAEGGKVVAIVCYFTFIGWLIGLLMHQNRRSSLGAWHLRQTLGFMLLLIAVYLLNYPLSLVPGPGRLISLGLNAGLVVLWLAGVYAAANGREKPMPLVGAFFQKWFAGFGL